MTDARAPEEAKELSRVARQIMWAGFPQTAEEILRAYATAQREAGRREGREGREEAAKVADGFGVGQNHRDWKQVVAVGMAIAAAIREGAA